jgi:pathogenesis-related protein 1
MRDIPIRLVPLLLMAMMALPARAQPWGYPPSPPYGYQAQPGGNGWGYQPPPGYPGRQWGYPAPPRDYQAQPWGNGARPVSMAQEMLNAHNQVRARVGVPPLGWSPQLADLAQNWADHLLRSRRFEHSPGNRFGENLFMVTGGPSSASEAVRDWADEVRDYDLRSNRCFGECGHYTQLVWASTRYVGCAVAADRHESVWVCEYDPPGNYDGERPY